MTNQFVVNNTVFEKSMIINHSDIKIALDLRPKSLNYNVYYISSCLPINFVLLFNIKLTKDLC